MQLLIKFFDQKTGFEIPTKNNRIARRPNERLNEAGIN